MNNNSRENRTAVITGATKGLGKALSLAFAKAGYDIIGVYRSDSDSAKAIESEFKASGLKGVFIRQDITESGNWAEFDEIIKTTEKQYLTLIANASPPFSPKPLHLIDWLEISEQFDVNAKGTFLIFKRLLPYMAKERKGTLISILSTALNAPPKGFAAYITAKSALEGLTRAIAAEYVPRGIRVFSVSPGFMETPLTAGWSEHLKAMIYSADGSIQQPDKIAAAILNLAEDLSIRGDGENYLLDAIQ